jgi:tripartite ATP-independent transporter DctM subunit
MLKHKYQAELASGSIAASGTLGQIIPPSIILVLLGDVVGVPVGRLFMAAVVPGIFLIILYTVFILVKARLYPSLAPALIQHDDEARDTGHNVFNAIKSLIAPLLLVLAVLGSIFFGVASPTESAAFGALGAMLLAKIHDKLSLDNLKNALYATTRMTSMVFIILIGATAFGLTFRGMHGDDLVHGFMTNLPGGEWGFIAASMLIIFILGFFLDFIEITFIVVPILAPIAVHFGLDPLWFTVLIAMNLQTSFLTPPFGFSLFYLKAAAPPDFRMQQIYKGIVPFVVIQLVTLMLLMLFPQTVLWLPNLMDSLR